VNWNQEQKLIPSDGAGGDYFGQSVALSGDVAVVGAWGDDYDRGAAYVFRHDGGGWTEEQKLVASDRAADDNFGASVAVSGNVAAAGAWGDRDNGDGSGSAYVFRYAGGTWSQEQKLTASDGAAGDFFGDSLALSGDVLVVGARLDNVASNTNQGSAYVFRFGGMSWSQEDKLLASDGAADDELGASVALFGDAAVVGAPRHNHSGVSWGAAYVFRYDGGAWSEEEELIASDGVGFNFFGESVALSSGLAVVGAMWDDVGANEYQGSAYVYRFDGGDWIEEAKLLASDGAAGDWFGWSVALSGNVALVGAASDDVGSNMGQGSVYVYDLGVFLPADCGDGVDTDGDGLIDLADPGCADVSDLSERDPTLPCDDGADNDGDGRIDFDPVTFAYPGDATTPPSGSGDPGCYDPSWGKEDPECQDGIHNDSDGKMDYDAGFSANGSAHPAGRDPQCAGKPWKNRECGLGVELALVLPALMWLRRRRARRA
jgi:hypothetical protein